MKDKNIYKLSSVLSIIGTFQLILLSSGKFYLIQIGDEDPRSLELKTEQPPKLSTPSQDNLNSSQHDVNHSSTKSPQQEDKYKIENQCACVSDPDRKISEHDGMMILKAKRLGTLYYIGVFGRDCCYRYWWKGQYCCTWSKYYCGWWG